MRMIIHDLEQSDFQRLFSRPLNHTMVISPDATIRHCLGCFGCWIKTPGACVIRDGFGDMGEHLSKCSEVLVIGQCCYGGFSPFVKNIFDRSISYVHPNFRNRNGEMHHKRRYKNTANLRVFFYGETITEGEETIARGLVAANALNLGWHAAEVSFSYDIAELEGRVG